MALGELEWAQKTPLMTAESWVDGIAASVVKSAAPQLPELIRALRAFRVVPQETRAPQQKSTAAHAGSASFDQLIGKRQE
jgi:hypothetical protein